MTLDHAWEELFEAAKKLIIHADAEEDEADDMGWMSVEVPRRNLQLLRNAVEKVEEEVENV